VLEDLKKAIQDGDVESFNQRLSLVEELFQDCDSTVRGLATSGALCYATRAGSIPMMDTLIKKGVDVNTKSNIEIDGYCGTQQWTPLLEAARSGKVGTVKYLVEKGADVNIRGCGKSTPLLEAIKIGKVDTVKYLVEKGADVNIKNDSEVSCLHAAVESANLDMVRYLCDNGADVTIKGMYNYNVSEWYYTADSILVLCLGRSVNFIDSWQDTRHQVVLYIHNCMTYPGNKGYLRVNVLEVNGCC